MADCRDPCYVRSTRTPADSYIDGRADLTRLSIRALKQILRVLVEHISSGKTHHRQGGAQRRVPIFPQLLPHQRDGFEKAEPGTAHVTNRYRDDSQNLRTQLLRIMRRAKVQPFEKPLHNMRAKRAESLFAKNIHSACLILISTKSLRPRSKLHLPTSNAFMLPWAMRLTLMTHSNYAETVLLTLPTGPKRPQTSRILCHP